MDPSVRNEKRADELKPGDWLATGPYSDRIDGTDDAEVLHVQPYLHGPHESVAILIQEATIPQPNTVYLPSGDMVRVLTDGEIAEVKALAARRQIGDELHRLADHISTGRLVLPDDSLSVAIGMQTRAEVVAVSDALDVPTAAWIKTGLQASWPKGRKSYEPGVRFLVYTDEKEPGTEPEPDADPTGLNYTRADDGDAPQVIGKRVEPHFEDGRVGVELGPDPNAACAEHDDAHLGSPCPDRSVSLTRCGCGPEHGPQCPEGF